MKTIKIIFTTLLLLLSVASVYAQGRKISGKILSPLNKPIEGAIISAVGSKDAKTGVDTLKGWIDDYESCRFTAIDSHTAVITSEYNMECLMEWLKRNTPIAEITEC